MARHDYSDEEDYYEQGFSKDGVVSVWFGMGGADADSDADILQDLCGVGHYRLDDQEVFHFDFELVGVRDLLDKLSYSVSFTQNAIAAAARKGIEKARWVVVQYNFNYDPLKIRRKIASDPVFIGCFFYSKALTASISKDEAKTLALTYIDSLDLKGYRYEFAGISSNENWPNEWGVVFDVYTPNGNLIDGPVVFVVEKDSGRVRSFEA